MFRKAERKQVKLKIGFSAASGAGKTYSALLVAYGMCGDWEKVAVIDTENGSAELYSDLGAYSVCPITPPFTPCKYIKAIQEAVDAGFKVLIIDSLSHAWAGTGGLLEMKDNAASKSKSGNSFTAWRDVTPEHNRLVNAILQSDIDVIVTTRAKSDYVISNDNGKTKVEKVGLAPVFREGLEYELTSFFDISQDHVATASKDRTKLFDGMDFVPTIETGKMFAEWRNNGAAIILATQEQKDTLAALGSKLENVARYFNIPIERLTYDQAQWAINEKRAKQQQIPQTASPESQAPTPESLSTEHLPQKTDAPVTPGINTRTILRLIEGTSFTTDTVNEWIKKLYGKFIPIDDLPPANFNDVYDALEKAVKKEKEGGNGNS